MAGNSNDENQNSKRNNFPALVAHSKGQMVSKSELYQELSLILLEGIRNEDPKFYQEMAPDLSDDVANFLADEAKKFNEQLRIAAGKLQAKSLYVSGKYSPKA